MSLTDDLSGIRVTTVPWPDALVPLGPYTTLAAFNPPPKTIHYHRGPVPWIDVAKVGVGTPPIRLYLGHTLTIPFDGTGWQIRPAYSANSISLNRPANAPPAVLQQHNCECWLDVPDGFRTPGLLYMSKTITVDFGDPARTVLQFPADGLDVVEYQIRASATWPATLTCQCEDRLLTEGNAWFVDGLIGGVLNAALARRRAILGNIEMTSVAGYEHATYTAWIDLMALICTPGGTAGQDTFNLQVRGIMHP